MSGKGEAEAFPFFLCATAFALRIDDSDGFTRCACTAALVN